MKYCVIHVINKDNFLNSIGTGIGYGYYCSADSPALISEQGIKLAGQNIIDSIGGEKIHNQPYLMFADFDSPDSTCTDCCRMGSRVPLLAEYIPTGGDSGGGIFRDNGGKCELIGIGPGGGVDADVFQKPGYYGQTVEWRRVSVFYDWIISKMCLNVTDKLISVISSPEVSGRTLLLRR